MVFHLCVGKSDRCNIHELCDTKQDTAVLNIVVRADKYAYCYDMNSLNRTVKKKKVISFRYKYLSQNCVSPSNTKK